MVGRLCADEDEDEYEDPEEVRRRFGLLSDGKNIEEEVESTSSDSEVLSSESSTALRFPRNERLGSLGSSGVKDVETVLELGITRSGS